MTRSPYLPPINRDLDVSGDPDPPVRAVKRTRIGNLEAYHTPRSKNLRLKKAGWLLPGKKHLTWAAFVIAAVILWRNAPRSVDVRSQDRELMPTAAMIAEISSPFIVSPEAEQIDRLREWGGTTKLRYRYMSANPTHPRIKAYCWLENSLEDAKGSFRKCNLNTVFDWGIGGKEKVGLVELLKKDTLADESRVYRVELDRRTLGYGMTLRSGTKTMYAKIEGAVIDQAGMHRMCVELADRLARAGTGPDGN